MIYVVAFVCFLLSSALAIKFVVWLRKRQEYARHERRERALLKAGARWMPLEDYLRRNFQPHGIGVRCSNEVTNAFVDDFERDGIINEMAPVIINAGTGRGEG